jgi:Zn-dependent protease with chaperone function
VTAQPTPAGSLSRGRPVPGPEHPETFFAAQARNRRASWRLALLCWLAIGLMAVPLAMVVSPPIFGVAAVILDATSLAIPTPDLIDAFSRTQAWAIASAVLLPGVALMIASWIIVRRLFLHGSVGGILLSLGARDPKLGDLEETQLQNVISEMAIAAGVPSPKLKLLDAGMSAAAVGVGIEDTTLVVSRHMPDVLDRDETQGIIGHLVASVGNGDLGIAHRIVSIAAASAVQLTRYPTGLATAIQRLARVDAALPGGPWASFLFAAAPRSARARFGDRDVGTAWSCLPNPDARVSRLRQMGADIPVIPSRWEGKIGTMRIVALVVLGPLAGC